MAGVQHYRMALDPAIQKLGTMTTNRHQYFRWTARSARINFAFVVAVPTILGIIAYKADGKWDFRAKRKGDLISEF
ncbi:NADH:ubiquinone oxidoreductase 6.6kD subunit [Hypoxylon trugodes]|uniref:NADH:ubiquinone oxidoreductase 6.6kD subunit n=1 Tax=Hypoxylon trugodes TaxID=326681 RepID=UPI00219A7E61|nr:NADH:ubiquinone oxidoreductase 6.6kD subunit [Hypoxylon trugodes]KAI1384692.1 NADH:ubiquinone oxidoreductase 6.6kD subunit [Hypoxylon trugodes]